MAEKSKSMYMTHQKYITRKMRRADALRMGDRKWSDCQKYSEKYHRAKRKRRESLSRIQMVINIVLFFL